MSSYFICPFFHAGVQFATNVGAPLSNGLIHTYQAGTTNAFSTWTSNTGAANNPNPIVLDSTGRLTQEIWLQYGQPMKFIVTDAFNNQIGPTLDNISGVNDTSESFNQVVVINSVSSSDTSNAASANAVKWAYNEGSLAYSAANAATTLAGQAYTAANNAANAGVSFYSNNVLVHTGNQLNFANSNSANFRVTLANTEVTVTLAGNSAAQNVSANGYTYLPGDLILQWGLAGPSPGGGGGAGAAPVTFPIPFPNQCLSVTAIPSGVDATLFVSAVVATGFTISNGTTGAFSYWMAIGH